MTQMQAPVRLAPARGQCLSPQRRAGPRVAPLHAPWQARGVRCGSGLAAARGASAFRAEPRARPVPPDGPLARWPFRPPSQVDCLGTCRRGHQATKYQATGRSFHGIGACGTAELYASISRDAFRQRREERFDERQRDVARVRSCFDSRAACRCRRGSLSRVMGPWRRNSSNVRAGGLKRWLTWESRLGRSLGYG
jgi:hypothetical protein